VGVEKVARRRFSQWAGIAERLAVFGSTVYAVIAAGPIVGVLSKTRDRTPETGNVVPVSAAALCNWFMLSATSS
jgi:hypothetical protein